MRIEKIYIRKILNSGGKSAVEVKVLLSSGHSGVASSPSALIPGIREVKATNCVGLDLDNIENLKRDLYKIRNINQNKLDMLLFSYIEKVGSDVTLAVSLAFARAISKYKNMSIVEYITSLTGLKSLYKAPYPIVAIFSGGVHSNKANSLQQIMISVNTNDFYKAIDIILNIYNTIENYLKANNMFVELGASSGFVVKNITVNEQFELLSNTISSLGYKDIVSIAIDVAAEHLKCNDSYRLENNLYSSQEFCHLIQNFIDNYNITFVEDPFDSSNIDEWKKLKNDNNILVVGDDLFATQKEYLNKEIANTIIIKMNQCGTLIKTLETISNAKESNLKLCVSHRSLETEDTFMCDLAVAINSEYIKIGGPRRMDRISKYNKILQLTVEKDF